MDKKHEDVGGVAQIDKTSVFQEGTATTHGALIQRGELAVWHGADRLSSTSIQPESRVAAEMQSGMSAWLLRPESMLREDRS